MPHKKIIEILVEMIKKYKFTEEEKTALLEAVGVLSWTSLREGTLKAIKEKKARSK